MFQASRTYYSASVKYPLTWRRPGLTNGRDLLKTQRSRAVAPSHEDVTSVSVKTDRKYVMVSGKGGVGKTSLCSSLAAKYAAEGHDTLVVSTDPAHSLGDSLGQRLPGGRPVAIEGTALPIWGMEIDPDLATQEFKSFVSTSGKDKVKVRCP
jgi:Mrp family chromosome partitioning ATPase